QPIRKIPAFQNGKFGPGKINNTPQRLYVLYRSQPSLLPRPFSFFPKPYFTFDFLDKRYCFKCLPFGLTSSSRVFTKILKPLIKLIRAKGIRVVVYLNDLLITQVKGQSIGYLPDWSLFVR